MSKATTVQRLRPLVERIVEEKLIELLGDPDSGLEVKESVKKRLLHSLTANETVIPASEVARRTGLKW